MTDFDLERDLVATCRLVAERANVYVEFICQRGGRRSGTTVGAPDALAYCNGRTAVCEFKRAADGRLSKGQVAAMELRREHGVETHVVRSVDDFVKVVNQMRRA